MAGAGGGPNYFQSIKTIFMQEGLVGFYRGCIPPMIGSIVYRSIQFSTYEAFYTKAAEFDSLT